MVSSFLGSPMSMSKIAFPSLSPDRAVLSSGAVSAAWLEIDDKSVAAKINMRSNETFLT